MSNGLDKILEDILREARSSADQILQEARQQADRITADAAAQADQECARIERNAEEQSQDAAARSQSAAALVVRQRILAARQELIAGVVQQALTAAKEQPAADYFDMILSMAAGAAHTGAGEIRFGKKDLERLPADFAAKLAGQLKAGSTLTVSPEAAPVDSGFILAYDGIEENCSFEAVLASKQEEIQDTVRRIIFE